MEVIQLQEGETREELRSAVKEIEAAAREIHTHLQKIHRCFPLHSAVALLFFLQTKDRICFCPFLSSKPLRLNPFLLSLSLTFSLYLQLTLLVSVSTPHVATYLSPGLEASRRAVRSPRPQSPSSPWSGRPAKGSTAR